MDTRKRMILAGVGLAGVMGTTLFWSVIHSSVRWALWAAVLRRPLGESEQRDLQACRPVGWWTWLKVVGQDVDVPCGEIWLVDTMAGKVAGGDRADWLGQWVETPAAPPRLRLRCSLVLAAAGQEAPVEPAWLLTDPALQSEVDAWGVDAAASDRAWRIHLGPRWEALGATRALAEARLDPREAVAAFEALALAGDAPAKRLAAAAAARALGVPPDLPAATRDRRRRGLPVGHLPRGWARALLTRSCADDACLSLWVDLLRLEAAVEGHDEPANDPQRAPVLRPLAEQLGFAGASARALEWWVSATARWVAAAPDPAARLASLAEGGGGGQADPVAVLWDRGGAPMTTAVVLSELGRRVGLTVEVRTDPVGAMWIDVGGQVVVRPACGVEPGASAPEGTPWPWEALVAGALAEAAADAAAQGSAARALRLAMAAEQLDPLGAAGASAGVMSAMELPADMHVGLAVGASLLAASEAPAGAEAGRRAAATGMGAARCR